jgi:hypothetical protein
VGFTDNLRVESGLLAGEVKGWIDFGNKSCDLKIKLNFARPLTNFMRDLPLLGVVLGPAGDAITTIYVRVSGPWERLHYSVWDPSDQTAPPAPELEPEQGTSLVPQPAPSP